MIFGFEGTSQELVKKTCDTIRESLVGEFVDVKIHAESLEMPEQAFVKTRNQYRAEPFLERLQNYVPQPAHGLGLVNLDLFVPDLNFIFGNAQFGGNAIVALPRLHQSFYGLPEDDSLFFQRTIKEVFHELGHVLGLRHCNNYCVMRFSNSLTDTDRKPIMYCPDCLRRLERNPDCSDSLDG